MKILAIETSCDETSVAILDNLKVISENTATSINDHKKTGGIIPEMAARRQSEYIIKVLDKTLSQANLKIKDIDKIAVTNGPGLIGSLLVGVETAKTLSLFHNKKIIPVNHLYGHIFSNWINKTSQNTPKFPSIALIVSGGHTDLIFMKNKKHIKHLGSTRDDAAGEAFDKTARILKLPYPGGPEISKRAKAYKEKNSNSNFDLFTRPMIKSNDFDFSFSGLKTAVLNYTKSHKKFDENMICAEIEEAICDVLSEKALKACQKYKPKSFLLSGGVAANQTLRYKINQKFAKNNLKTKIFVPEIKYCTDNAAMIGAAAFLIGKTKKAQKINANPELNIK